MRRQNGQLRKILLMLAVGLLTSAVVYNFYAAAEEEPVQPEKEEVSSAELLTKAREFYYQGKYEQSINFYQQAVETEKKQTALSNLAVIYEEQGNYSQAAEQYQKLLQVKEKPEFRLGLAVSYYNLNKLEAATETLQQLTAGKQEAVSDYILRDAYYYLGLIAGHREAYQPAEEHLRTAIAEQEFALGYYQLGEIYFAQEAYQQARDYYRQALQIDGSLKGVNYKLGLAYLNLGAPQQAVNYLQRARRENSRLAVVKEKLASLKEEYPQYFQPADQDDDRLPADKEIPEQTEFREIEPLSNPGPRIRVGIMEDKSRVKLRVGSDFQLKQGEEVIAEGKQGQLLTAAVDNGQQVVEFGGESLTVQQPVTIVPQEYAPIVVYNVGQGAGYYWAAKKHRQYRGNLELKPTSTGFTVINLVHLEEYLLSVVPSEMSASWPLEALKVQSVAARSYTLANLGKHGAAGYDLCSTVHCAAYRGITREASRVNRAVRVTLGEIMTYNGYAINAVYSANSGGHTENSEDVWSAEIPYLRGVSTEKEQSNFPLPPAELKEWLQEVPASYSRGNKYTKLSHYRWQRNLSVEYLEARLGIEGIKQIIPEERGEAGSVQSIRVVGAAEQKQFKSGLRSRLGGLRSNRFWVQPQYREGELVSFLFYGSGWGHSVGMDQVAVAGMAEAGKEYTTILRHFYSEVKIEDWY